MDDSGAEKEENEMCIAEKTIEDYESYEEMAKKRRIENLKYLRGLGIPVKIPLDPSPNNGLPEKLKTRKVKRSSNSNITPVRRSSRLLGQKPVKNFLSFEDDVSSCETPTEKRENIFGAIPGVAVGTQFETRLQASHAGVHRPTVAGIHGNSLYGCYSIALSGGYEDDVDMGDTFTYTGEGGRNLKGSKANPKNLRTAPQSKDQVLERGNLALVQNIEKNLPVRVIRGYKLQSEFAPEEGYRYDGLYEVQSYYTTKGLSGFNVFKFCFKRLENQERAPWSKLEKRFVSNEDSICENGFCTDTNDNK